MERYVFKRPNDGMDYGLCKFNVGFDYFAFLSFSSHNGLSSDWYSRVREAKLVYKSTE